MQNILSKTGSTAEEMNDKADKSGDDVADPGVDLKSQNLIDTNSDEVKKDMSNEKEQTKRRSSLKQDEENAKGHLGRGDIHSLNEKALSSCSAEGHDLSSTSDDKQPKDEDMKVDNPQQESEKDKDENHLDDLTCTGDGVTSSQVNPEMKHSKKESYKDELPERKNSCSQEEENTDCDIHSAGESPPAVDQCISSTTKYYIISAFVIGLALLARWIPLFLSPPVQKDFNLTRVFHQEMDKVQNSFPSQPNELWRRSRIHLWRHLQMTHPTEPVSLLLTSGRGAEKTLACLAQRLAAAFSTALNASVLDIDGASKTAQDPEQVKLDIDLALKEAFEGGKRSAVIHRFEELPPGSTLIFYRYCDHENAAFKKVFLTFTVLLEKLDFSPNISLGLVEEQVHEYVKEKFISSRRTARQDSQFNQMDIDKLSGLWSRISHVILPVAPENTIEQQGCQQ